MTSAPTHIFTRHLYELDDVKYSLFVEMMNRNYDKVLFWTYELYYSGWSDTAFEWSRILYDKYYRVYDPRFIDYMEKQIRYYNDIRPEDASSDPSIVVEPDTIIGNIFINMMYLPTSANKRKKIRVVLRAENIQKYLPTYTEEPETVAASATARPYRIMRNRCQYGVVLPRIDEHVQLLGMPPTRHPISLFMLNNWVYWASFSPIWEERIQAFSGRVNHANKSVEFETEDDYEAFYDKYGYEPDEQSNEIHRLCGAEVYGQ